MVRRWFHRTVLGRRWLAFATMGLAFIGFGVGTLNLFMLFKANAELFQTYGGRQAIMDGGLQQLIELLLTGYASLGCYLVFKSCEYTLVRHLSEADRHSTVRAQSRSESGR